MITNAIAQSHDNVDLNTEVTWNDFYPALRSFARYLVRSFQVASWRGQEEDIIEDIVQETARRLIERTRKAERGEADPIRSLKNMMTVIAKNYCKDLRRSDRRLSRAHSQGNEPETAVNAGAQTHALDAVTESVYQESLFTLVAHEIANFPEKQRKALLVDLANRMCFDTKPTPLQKAFLKEGIQLRRYQQPLPADPRERSRQIAILSYAYRQISRLPCVQAYNSAT